MQRESASRVCALIFQEKRHRDLQYVSHAPPRRAPALNVTCARCCCLPRTAHAQRRPTSPAASRNSAAAAGDAHGVAGRSRACAIRSCCTRRMRARNCICRCRPVCRSTDAALQFDGSYLRGNGGRTTMLLSLDGAPVLSRARRSRRAMLRRLSAWMARRGRAASCVWVSTGRR